MPSIVTKSVQRARRYRCQRSGTRDNRFYKKKRKRKWRHRINREVKELKYNPYRDIVELKPTEMYTNRDVF